MTRTRKHDHDAIVHGYVNGQTVNQLAATHDAPDRTIRTILDRKGVAGLIDGRHHSTARTTPQPTIDRIRQLAGNGMTQRQIQAATGTSAGTVSKYTQRPEHGGV